MSNRVVVTINQLSIGGVETRLLRFLREVQRRGLDIDVAVLVASGKPGRLDEAITAAGARLYYGREGSAGLIDLWRLCRSFRPHVLHVNAQFAGGFYCMAGWAAGVGSRVSHLSTSGRGRKAVLAPVSSAVYALLLRSFSTAVVGVSDATRRGSLVADSKWLTIYDGVDPGPLFAERPGGYDANRLNILMLGRADPIKNVPRAMRIAAALKRRGPSPILHLLGPRSPDEAAAEQALIAELQIADVVKRHGYVDDIAPHLLAADVLLLPSFNEGLPGAVLEALSCGLPVVASDLAGVKEIGERTSGVTAVSLEEDDDRWIEALVQSKHSDRAAIRDAFNASPFLFERAFDASLSLWYPPNKSSQS